MTFGVCSPSGLFPKRISRRYYLFKISRYPFYRATAQSAGYFVNPFKLLGRKGGVVYRLDIIEYL